MPRSEFLRRGRMAFISGPMLLFEALRSDIPNRGAERSPCQGRPRCVQFFGRRSTSFTKSSSKVICTVFIIIRHACALQ